MALERAVSNRPRRAQGYCGLIAGNWSATHLQLLPAIMYWINYLPD